MAKSIFSRCSSTEAPRIDLSLHPVASRRSLWCARLADHMSAPRLSPGPPACTGSPTHGCPAVDPELHRLAASSAITTTIGAKVAGVSSLPYGSVLDDSVLLAAAAGCVLAARAACRRHGASEDAAPVGAASVLAAAVAARGGAIEAATAREASEERAAVLTGRIAPRHHRPIAFHHRDRRRERARPRRMAAAGPCRPAARSGQGEVDKRPRIL